MKIKLNWQKACEITRDFVAPLVKPFIAALIGGGVVSGISGCSSLVPSAKTQSMSLYAIGIPGIAVVTKSEQLSDNSGGDENKPVQANPVTVEAKAK